MFRILVDTFFHAPGAYLIAGILMGMLMLAVSKITRTLERRYIRDHLKDIVKQEFDDMKAEIKYLKIENERLTVENKQYYVKMRDALTALTARG